MRKLTLIPNSWVFKNSQLFVFLLFTFFIFQKNSIAQQQTLGDDLTYEKWMKKGKTAFQNEDYKLCASCYEKASALAAPQKYQSLYQAARCHALNGKAKKATKYLVRAINADYGTVKKWTDNDEADFAKLKKKKRCWKKVQKAMEIEKSKKESWASKVDQVEMEKGRPQVFGTQIKKDEATNEFYFYKILNEKKVEERRVAIGLDSIKNYARQFGFEYTPKKKKKLTQKEFNKFMGGWDMVNIRNATTHELIFQPKKTYWVEFKRTGFLHFNLDVNTCKFHFQATDKGRLIFSPVYKCSKKCCDDKKIKSILNYMDVLEFELYDKLLYLITTKNQILVLTGTKIR